MDPPLFADSRHPPHRLHHPRGHTGIGSDCPRELSRSKKRKLVRTFANLTHLVQVARLKPAILNVNRYSVWAALGGAGAVPVRRIDSGEHQGIRTAP